MDPGIAVSVLSLCPELRVAILTKVVSVSMMDKSITMKVKKIKKKSALSKVLGFLKSTIGYVLQKQIHTGKTRN